jgi:hypothetical protein
MKSDSLNSIFYILRHSCIRLNAYFFTCFKIKHAEEIDSSILISRANLDDQNIFNFFLLFFLGFYFMLIFKSKKQMQMGRYCHGVGAVLVN